jgi:hypothetical protein
MLLVSLLIPLPAAAQTIASTDTYPKDTPDNRQHEQVLLTDLLKEFEHRYKVSIA